MNNLNITERTHNAVVVLDLNGNIRLGKDVVWLRHKLKALAERGENRILLNMAEITNVDSSGLGEMVAGYTSVTDAGGELKLLNLTSRVKELMVITKLVTVFDTFDDELKAVNSFSEPNVVPVVAAPNKIPVIARNNRVETVDGR